MIELRMLGGVDLRGADGKELRSIVAGPKRLALLAYLALQSPSGYQRRDKLLGLFWPELDQEHARNALRNALSILRRGLGSGVLMGLGDEELAVDAARLWCDAVAFERALEAGELEEGLGLYRGDLLEGFFLGGAPEFEDWLEARRSALREHAARAAWRLATRQEAEGNVAGAAHWARRAAAFAPHDEDVQRRLIELLSRVADRSGAIAAYEAFARRLATDLELEPMPETRALVEGIRADSPLGGARSDRTVVATDAGRGSPIREESVPPDPIPSARRRGSTPKRLRPRLVAFFACVLLAVAGLALLARRGTTARGAEDTASESASTVAARIGTAGSGAEPAIAVLPFQVNAAAMDPWREGMVDLLSINLDGAPGLRTVDSRTLLARWRERAPAGVADLATTLAVARRAGARYALVGSAVAIGSDVRFVAEIYDADGEKLGSVQMQGSPDSVFALVDGLSVEVLRQLLPRTGTDLPRVDLAAVTTRSPTALKAWLEGERLWRRSEADAAAAAYKQAVQADSTFALPLLRLGFPLRFGASLNDSIARRLAGQIDRLRPADALLVRANLLLAKDDAREKLRGLGLLREASIRYPDNPDVWYQLGDVLHHAKPHVVNGIDGGADERAFSRALELDSTYAAAYIHLLDNAFSRGDSARVADLIGAYRRLEPAQRVDVLELSFALGFGDPATRRRALAAVDTIPVQKLVGAMFTLTHPRFRAVEEDVIEELGERPDWPAPHEIRIVAWYVSLGSGKLRRALEALDDPPVTWRSVYWGAYRYFPYTSGLPVPHDRLERELVLTESDSLSDVRTFYAGAYAADRGRWAEHTRAVARLRRSSESADVAPWWIPSVAEALEGYGLWRRGRAEQGLRHIEAAQAGILLSPLDWRHWTLLRTMNSWHGRMLLELGRAREAVPYFETTAFDFAPDPLDAYYLGRACAASDQPEEARRAYDYFAAAWKDSDPELRPMVEEARAAAVRLATLRE